jgi:hypothetical protein
MRKGFKVIALLLVLLMLFGAAAPAAYAKDVPPPDDSVCKYFYLGAVHGINGERLGLDAALPVDVYVNGGYAFTFEFKDMVTAKLPAGEYTITVNLAGTDTEVMSLGPVEIPGCVKVVVKATLVDGVPTLKAKIRELLPK